MKPNALAALIRTVATSSVNNAEILWFRYSAVCCCWLEPALRLWSIPMMQAAFPRISGQWLLRCGKHDSKKSDT